jgi:hypothetical protein
MRHLPFVAVSFALLIFPSSDVPAQDSATALTVRGDVLHPGSWTAGDLREKFSKEIGSLKFTSGRDKQEHAGVGIPLSSLLAATGPRTEKAPKHHDLTFLVVLEALDHYRVFFSLAELLPACGRAQAWLVWEVDGKPLSGTEAPFRLVVLSDQGHDRFIHGIATITLLDGTKIMNQLAAGK